MWGTCITSNPRCRSWLRSRRYCGSYRRSGMLKRTAPASKPTVRISFSVGTAGHLTYLICHPDARAPSIVVLMSTRFFPVVSTRTISTFFGAAMAAEGAACAPSPSARFFTAGWGPHMLIGYTTSTSFFTFFAAARTFRMSSSVLSRPAVRRELTARRTVSRILVRRLFRGVRLGEVARLVPALGGLPPYTAELAPGRLVAAGVKATPDPGACCSGSGP